MEFVSKQLCKNPDKEKVRFIPNEQARGNNGGEKLNEADIGKNLGNDLNQKGSHPLTQL